MNKIKILTKTYVCLLVLLNLFVSGCASFPVVYHSDLNAKPQMSLPEAYHNIKHGIQLAVWDNQATVNNIQVTSQGFSYELGGSKVAGRFDEILSLTVSFYNAQGGYYCLDANPSFNYLCWRTQTDAQNFVDAESAMKYYASKHLLIDDETTFTDFQEKLKVWQALPQKPSLTEEARRFRVLADDAVENKDYDKAADYYEQGLAIDPMWPVGQFNAAMIYEELKSYSMAAMHMKCYLLLEPGTKDARAYQDKIYVWEEKAKETNPNTVASSGNSSL